MTTNLSMRIGGALVLLLAATAARAGQVPSLTTFAPNTPARAAEVNSNFSTLANEVNDNDTRIDTLQSRADATDASLATTQTRVAGACPANSSIRVIGVDGSVTCETDDAGPSYTGASPITVSGSSIGLATGGITNTHVSSAAAIAVSKIAGDVGADYNDTFWSLGTVTTSVTSIGSITVSAPSAGVILLFMNGEASNSGVNFLYEVGIGTSATAFSLGRTLTPQPNAQTFGVMWASAVSAAGAYTFHALARKIDPTACCTASLSQVNLLAVFVPKRY